MALGFMTVPLLTIMQAWNSHHFPPLQPHQRRIDHVFSGHHDLLWQVLYRVAGLAPEVGGGRTR
ncbi:hypothetical protein D3C78_1993400 [compost metagenome]